MRSIISLSDNLTAVTAPSEVITDTEVSGFFDFTVNTNVGITYPFLSASAQARSRFLLATPPQPTLPGTPAPGTTADGTVYVTELAESGFTLEKMTVVPADRKQGERFNVAFPNSQLCAFYHEFIILCRDAQISQMLVADSMGKCL